MHCKLLSDGTYKYTYDADGNMVSQTNIATGSVTYYTWDYRNRLVEVKQESSTGTVLNDEKFTYDVFNNRIAVSLNGTLELYTVYDGANPYLDFNGSGQLTERYLTNPNTLSQFYGQVNASGTVQWFLTDNIYSIRQVVSTSGSVLDAIAYDPYGNILSQTNTANAPRMMYAGGIQDSITGNDQFDRRYYSPADGRWLSQDPLEFGAGDFNLYRYTNNRPIEAVDPNGEKYEYTINYEKKIIYVTMELSIYGSDATQELGVKWARAIIQEWSGYGNSSIANTDEWYVSFSVNVQVSNGYWSSDYNNIIEVKPSNWDPRGGGHPGGTVRRGIFSDTGSWAVNASDFVIAHEAGHLLNFDDYYDRKSGRPLPGYSGTIMGEYNGTATAPGPGGMSFRDRLISRILRFGQ